jgi:hypothetical protein
MKARVFISCGQATEQERIVSEQLRQWFHDQGYDPYVAVKVQTITDLNAGIIEALKSSDYYLFINFKREEIIREGKNIFRGSLYSHQELAVAYALGFDHMLLVNNIDVHDEGVQSFIVSNVPRFSDFREVLPIVQQAVTDSHWSPTYSRQLSIGGFRWADPVLYRDQTGERSIRVLHADIHNNRKDRPAYGLIGHLEQIREANTGKVVEHHDKTFLKATGFLGYQHTTWPDRHSAFDLLALSCEDPNLVYLNSCLDVSPRQPILTEPGEYLLDFHFIAQDFPMLTKCLRFVHDGSLEPSIPIIEDAQPRH